MKNNKDNGSPPGLPLTWNVRLKSAADIKRLLSRTIRELVRDGLSEKKARTIGYLSSVLLQAFNQIDLDQRLSNIEVVLKDRGLQ